MLFLSTIIFSWIKSEDHIQKYLTIFVQKIQLCKIAYQFWWGVGWKEEGRKLEEPGVCLQMPVIVLLVVKMSEMC
jgi:hypothetical protein